MIDLSGVTTIPAMRAIRREHSKALRDAPNVLPIVIDLIDRDAMSRIFAYELLHHHKPTLHSLTTRDIRRLGDGNDSWEKVDTFAMYISGPAFRDGQLSDAEVARWARSSDEWWRRAALATTIVASRAGGFTERVLRICTILVSDRDDMVVKAMSWALRELTKTDRQAVQTFLTLHDVAPRVRREVTNKLRTGKKN